MPWSSASKQNIDPSPGVNLLNKSLIYYFSNYLADNGVRGFS
jgi:hypothetical protein